ncbi:MAG: RusA family crossover junction endodeoxyribonuclease [Anaerolineales bacterium]|nr:MAG: RusA family crossover junction endodeoxyribonuclease [Anaerolineales bacterium]
MTVQRVRFTLPLPPGVNNQYTRAGNRRVLSKEHRAFKRAVRKKLGSLRTDDALSDEFIRALKQGFVGLFLDFYFETPLKRDLDGGLKIAQDAILDPLGVNDNRVVDIHLVKRIDPLRPRLEVELEAISDWHFDTQYYVVQQTE